MPVPKGHTIANGLLAPYNYKEREPLPIGRFKYIAGRTPNITEEMKPEIIRRIAEGDTQTAIAKDLGISYVNIYDLGESDAEFGEAVGKAKRIAAESRVMRTEDRLIESERRLLSDEVEGKKSNAFVNLQNVITKRAEWLAERTNPSEWGNKQTIDINQKTITVNINIPTIPEGEK